MGTTHIGEPSEASKTAQTFFQAKERESESQNEEAKEEEVKERQVEKMETRKEKDDFHLPPISNIPQDGRIGNKR